MAEAGTTKKARHSGESRNPIGVKKIPAFAGMTKWGRGVRGRSSARRDDRSVGSGFPSLHWRALLSGERTQVIQMTHFLFSESLQSSVDKIGAVPTVCKDLTNCWAGLWAALAANSARMRKRFCTLSIQLQCRSATCSIAPPSTGAYAASSYMSCTIWTALARSPPGSRPHRQAAASQPIPSKSQIKSPSDRFQLCISFPGQ